MSTYTQREVDGLFELTESTLAELKSSKYYNDDLSPTSVSERSWTTYSITMLWVGMSICIPSLSLASGLIAMGVSPWLSVLNVALGNVIILIPIQILTFPVQLPRTPVNRFCPWPIPTTGMQWKWIACTNAWVMLSTARAKRAYGFAFAMIRSA